jgi:hypothetical protein
MNFSMRCNTSPQRKRVSASRVATGTVQLEKPKRKRVSALAGAAS